MTILLPVRRFWPFGVIKTVGNGALVMSPVVGHGHSGRKWGPVLGATALPASTPTTPSVEEYPTDKLTPIYRFLPCTYTWAGGQYESENISGYVSRRVTKISEIVAGLEPGPWPEDFRYLTKGI